MAVGERQTQKHRRKMPSFSSSLLDSIYHSIDEPPDHRHPPPHSTPHRRDAAAHDEIESLRRAIMIEKWMENYSASTSRHLPSNSASSTDSSSCIFTASASDTDSSTPRPVQNPEPALLARLNRTKSKKAKPQPLSPGGRIANFLNSIFSPKKEKIVNHPGWSSVRKSRSMKDTTKSCLINTTTTATTSSRNNKSKRSVRFCPVSLNIDILDDEHSHGRELSAAASMANVVGSRYIKKNMESIRLYENEKEKEKEKEKEMRDFDDKSCASSDLFELENIGNYESELPVYATTNLRRNPPFSIRN